MVITLAIAIAALTVIAYVATLRSLTTQTDRVLLREADAYDAAMQGAPDDQALVDATRAYLEARTGAGAGPDPILTVMFSNGRTISNSELRLERASGNAAAREPTSSPAGFADARFDGRTFRIVSAPVKTSAGRRIGLFQAALADEESHAVASSVAATLALAGLVTLACGAALSWWAAGESLRPLRRMATTAAGVTHATPGLRIDYDGPPDELGSLADSLNAMLDRLEEAYAEQRRFVADASHELRTPVAIVHGNVELLRSGRATGAEASEALSMIEAETTRMARLLDDLLALARAQGAARRPFQELDVATLSAEVLMRAHLLGDRSFEGTCSHGIWISGDPDLIEQALLNIVRNAVAHTAVGDCIALTCSADERHVRIAIADGGPGIPEDDLPRIFDRFFRVPGRRSTETGGSGLGLAIARSLVELHGGTIAAANAEGGGAVFTVELPRIAAPE